MLRMKVVGWVVFVIVAAVGAAVFNDWRQKAEAKAEQEAGAYFMTLVREEPSVSLNLPAGGAPVHPWVLASTPNRSDVHKKVRVAYTSDGTWLTWKLRFDPSGGTAAQPIQVRARFDREENLETLHGIHGTVGRQATDWQPE